MTDEVLTITDSQPVTRQAAGKLHEVGLAVADASGIGTLVVSVQAQDGDGHWQDNTAQSHRSEGRDEAALVALILSAQIDARRRADLVKAGLDAALVAGATAEDVCRAFWRSKGKK